MKSNNRALEGGGPHVHLLPRPLYPRGSDGTHGKKACYSFVTLHRSAQHSHRQHTNVEPCTDRILVYMLQQSL
jgi:hypothetical protein